MKNQKNAYISYFLFCAVTAVYLLATGGGEAGSRSGDPGDRTAARTGGNGGSGFSRGADSNGGRSAFDKGVVLPEISDGGVGPSKKTANSGNEPKILDPADPDNPRNPKTGQPYTNSQMEKFSKLRARFPNNSLIPSKKTPETVQKERESRVRMYSLQTRVSSGRASHEEIDELYNLRLRSYKDRLELLEYFVEKYGKTMEGKNKEMYTKVLKSVKNQISSFEKSRQRAHDRLKAKEEQQ